MVLHKSEINKHKAMSFADSFRLVEANIDAALAPGRATIYSSTIMSKVLYHKEDFLEYVINKYKQAGWYIKREKGYDQKDGTWWDYLVFY